MCGICGRLNFDGTPVSMATLEAMTDIMGHRGPDDRDVLVDGAAGLGHRRLSIIDLSPLGRQPMTNEDGTIAVVFNGEIYNYKELRSELKAAGHCFRSASDTEVIVHAYEEYGSDLATKFNGMFAFALWNSRRKELLLCRDRLGVKPLYYCIGQGFITFASEIKSVLEDRDCPREVDLQAMSNFLTLHYVPGPRTMFRGIHKLQPGHTLIAGNGSVRVKRYWELRKDATMAARLEKAGEKELTDLVYSALKESVSKRMQSDVPVGALLSGGLDSSAILGLMTELTGRPVPSFTVGYSDSGSDGYSEFRHSRKAARHFQSSYREVVVGPEMFLDFLPRAIWHQDEPIGEPASVPLYFVSRLAKDNGVTVLLTGEGSDELFAGYNRHWGEILSEYYLKVPEVVRGQLIGRLLGALPMAPLLKKGHRSMTLGDFSDRYMSWHTVFTEEDKRELMNGADGLQSTFTDVFEARLGPISALENLDKILMLDVGVWLPDDLLMKKDKMGMAASVEARVPFLDYTFVEMAFQLPARHKVRRLTTKYILKKAMERLVPTDIIYRKKEGFPTPISAWLRGPLREFTMETLCSDRALRHGLIDRKAAQRVVSAHMSGRQDYNRLIFPLLNFEIWHSIFISGRAQGGGRQWAGESASHLRTAIM